MVVYDSISCLWVSVSKDCLTFFDLCFFFGTSSLNLDLTDILGVYAKF